MSNRTLDSSTKTALLADPTYLIFILRLDIANDPVYIHTGLGPSLTFGAGYDIPLQGFTFLGLGVIGSIDAVNDSTNGSQSLNLVLPGIDTSVDYLHQLINNGDLWQRKLAYLWMATVDSTCALIGKPVRLKSGRIDQLTMVIDPTNAKGELTVSLESQQAYSGDALFSRYAEQKDLVDSTDISQDFAAASANAIPGIGQPNTNPFGGGNGSSVGGRGGYGGVSIGYNRY